MICPQCGEENHYILKSCKKCGHPFHEDQPGSPTYSAASETPQEAPRAPVSDRYKGATAFMQPPAIMTWYRAYCVFVIVASGILLFIVGYIGPLVQARADVSSTAYQAFMLFNIVIYGLAFFLPNTPGAWVYHLVLICFGFLSICCLPVCIPLLIYWIKPETTRYFGRS